VCVVVGVGVGGRGCGCGYDGIPSDPRSRTLVAGMLLPFLRRA
jgi:hypothetical protein